MALAPPSRASRNKREQILEAAERLFAAAGYERVSVDAIAAESGVSKPTVYSHFGGKEGLYRAYLARAALAMNQRFARVLPGITASAQWRDALTTAGVSLVQCQRSPESIALSRQLQTESLRDPSLVREVWAESATPLLDGLAGRLAILANAGHLEIEDPDLAARHFLALISAEMQEITLLGTVPGDDAAVERSVVAGVDAFVRAYRPAG